MSTATVNYDQFSGLEARRNANPYDPTGQMLAQAPHVTNTQAHLHLQNPQRFDSAPYAMSSYQTDPRQDTRVYAGTFKDPVSGVEYHTWEEPPTDRQVDYNLNPDTAVMDRLFELHSGGLNEDTCKKLGIPEYRDESNYRMFMNNPEDGLHNRKADEAVRQYAEARGRAEALRKMENNFQGVDDSLGMRPGHMGLQPLHYARAQDAPQVTAFELDERERLTNPDVRVEMTAPRTAPRLFGYQEARMDWEGGAQVAQTFGFRDVNDYPGDAEARSKPPTFVENPPQVQVLLS